MRSLNVSTIDSAALTIGIREWGDSLIMSRNEKLASVTFLALAIHSLSQRSLSILVYHHWNRQPWVYIDAVSRLFPLVYAFATPCVGYPQTTFASSSRRSNQADLSKSTLSNPTPTRIVRASSGSRFSTKLAICDAIKCPRVSLASPPAPRRIFGFM